MTTTFEMTWEDPGPARVGRPGDSHLRQVLAELQKHPGRWAKVAESKANGGQGPGGRSRAARPRPAGTGSVASR